jgi:hypothetical protein
MKNNKNILIEGISKELPFSVPENYFEQFALQMEDRIGFKKSIIRKALRPWMYIAAMFIGIMIMGQIFYTVNKNNATRNAEKYESYVLSQVDENSLADLYVDEPTK